MMGTMSALVEGGIFLLRPEIVLPDSTCGPDAYVVSYFFMCLPSVSALAIGRYQTLFSDVMVHD